MNKIEVNEQKFRDIWKSNKNSIETDLDTDELIKIQNKEQWLICRPIRKKEEKIEIKIILAKYQPY